MGTWGIGLYSNDSAADLRDQFQTIVRAPWDGARILAYLLEKFPSGNDPKDEEYTDLRLAIADLFWQYAIDHPPSFRLAADIVQKGTDLDSKRALGMSAADLKKRGKGLEELRTKWRMPNGKPRPRRVLKSPESFLVAAGDCLLYPTSRGNPINPHVSDSGRAAYDALYNWKQDGWGTVLVLATFRRFDVLARYLVAVLDFADAEKPALERFRSLHILHANMGGGGPVTRVHAVHTTASQLKRMRVETAGRLLVNDNRIAADFAVDKPPLSLGDNDFCNVAGFNLDPSGNAALDYPVAVYLR
jgi:hypothetical protein